MIEEKAKSLKESEQKAEQYREISAGAKKALEEIDRKIGELQAKLKSFEENDLFLALEQAIEKVTLTDEAERWRSYFCEKLRLVKQYEPSRLREAAELEIENVIRGLDGKLTDRAEGQADAAAMKEALYASIEAEKQRAAERTEAEKQLAALTGERALRENEIQVANERLAETLRSADLLRSALLGERERLASFGNGKSISEIVRETGRQKELLIKKKEVWDETNSETQGTYFRITGEKSGSRRAKNIFCQKYREKS